MDAKAEAEKSMQRWRPKREAWRPQSEQKGRGNLVVKPEVQKLQRPQPGRLTPAQVTRRWHGSDDDISTYNRTGFGVLVVDCLLTWLCSAHVQCTFYGFLSLAHVYLSLPAVWSVFSSFLLHFLQALHSHYVHLV